MVETVAKQVQIIQLKNDQISRHWDEIANALENTLPGAGNELMANVNNVMKAMLAGRMQCWVGYEKTGDNGTKEVKVNAIATTCFFDDQFSGRKDLLIYGVYGWNFVGPDHWRAWYDALRKYARAQGCQKITAYTFEPRVVELVEMLGGDASRRYIELEV